MNYDICIVSIPYNTYNFPSAAPALLKGHLQGKGFSVLTRDLNIEFRNMLDNETMLTELIGYWFDHTTKLSESTGKIYWNLLEQISLDLTQIKTKWLGLSVFSYHSQVFCRDILKCVSKHKPADMKIVIGGCGVTSFYASTIKKYIDVYIVGEGELALEHLLVDDYSYPGINSQGIQVDDLDQIGFADYSDYNLHNYDTFYNRLTVQVTGSRGCVRNCTFCDVSGIWPKYRYKSGKLIAQEIITTYEKSKITDFFFTDSLINGNLKELMVMMRELADYREKHNVNISWGGQWIARKQKGLPVDYYDLIKRSGGYNLTIGVETGSDKVREDMKKGFTNADLDAELENFSKHGITCSFYILLGYITETEADFIETLDMFKKYTPYVADGTIVGVILGSGFIPTPEAPISKQENITWVSHSNNKDNESFEKWFRWESLDTNSSYIDNIRRRIIAQLVIDNLKWPNSNTLYEIGSSLSNLKNIDLSELNKFTSKIIDINKDFVQRYKLETSETAEIELTLTGQQGVNYPEVEILLNDIVLQKVTLQEQQTLKFNCKINRRNLLKIRFNNKTNADNIIGPDGNLVRQKCVVIDEIKINGIRSRKNDIRFHGNIRNANGKKIKDDGLYDNGVYVYYFTNSIEEFFINKKEFFYNKQSAESNAFTEEAIKFYNQLISHT